MSDRVEHEYLYEFEGEYDEDGELWLVPKTPDAERLAETLNEEAAE